MMREFFLCALAIVIIFSVCAGIVMLCMYCDDKNNTSEGHYLVRVTDAKEPLTYHAVKFFRDGDRHIIVTTEDGQHVSIYGSFVIEEVMKAEKP